MNIEVVQDKRRPESNVWVRDSDRGIGKVFVLEAGCVVGRHTTNYEGGRSEATIDRQTFLKMRQAAIMEFRRRHMI